MNRRLIGAAAVTAAALAVPLATGPLADRTVRVAAPLAAPVAGVPAAADRQSALVAAEDRRLLTLVSTIRPGSAPYTIALDGVDTLVLTAGGLPYGLADLTARGAATVEPDGAVLLTRHVFVAPGARLDLHAPGRALRMRSEAAGFVSLVAWKADLTLAGVDGERLTVTSWDPAARGPDRAVEDGRAYVRDVSGAMTVRHTDVTFLGFWAGRTGGVAWTGSSRQEATGSVTDSSFRNNHYGAFASRGERLTVSGATFAGNAVDGLCLHRSTAETTIRSSTARDNGRHGFAADQGSEAVSFTDVTAAGNRAHGIFFSGSPLAEGPSAGGAPLHGYGEVVITGGVLRGNGRAGLRVVDGADVTVAGTRVADNRDGIVLVDTAAPTTVQDAVVTGAHRFGISVDGGSAALAGNEVTGGQTAIRVRDATATVVRNTVAKATEHGISVVGRAAGSAVERNTVGGRGPSGLDTFRLDAGLPVELSGNDVEGWETDRDNWAYWAAFVPNHPMLVLWVVVLGIPAGLALRGRRHPLVPGTAPYRDVLRQERPPAVRVDVGRRVVISEKAA
ncbi:MAG TPA: right-handed parallel beta-helix repeat-containing protein [Geodermatophilus sp.]|nr:right-handed parallel beta-helix repeat-containing protein [Geodermatophilus sp.]